MAGSMGSITWLGSLIGSSKLEEYTDESEWFTKRDEIKQALADHLLNKTTREWLDILEPADYWAAKVNTIKEVA